MTDRAMMKSALESMLFVWGEPLEAKTAAKALDAEEILITECLKELQAEYDDRAGGIRIQRFGNCFQLCTAEENREAIERLCNPVREKKLSRSALEVLAIIAYRQPVTRGEIESIRGVRSSYVLEGLVQKGLIEETGRSEAVGRPILYGTTNLFLRHFGIENLSELPELEEESFLPEAGGPEAKGSVSDQ